MWDASVSHSAFVILKDIMEEIGCERYGVIVTNGTQREFLLPDFGESDVVEQQISIARQKAGIGPDEDVTLQRFEVVRHT